MSTDKKPTKVEQPPEPLPVNTRIRMAEDLIRRTLDDLSTDLIREGLIVEGMDTSVMTHREIGHQADAQIFDVTVSIARSK